MEYHFENVGKILKVSLDGRLVAACSEEFRELMFDRLKESRLILFDLTSMAHIDSSGLGALVAVLQKVTVMGGVVKLACLQSRPRIVFDITKVYRIFDIFDTVEAGLDSFGPAL